MPHGPRTATPDYRRLFESTPLAQLVVGDDLVVAAVSEAWLVASGIARERVIGHPLPGVFAEFPGPRSAAGAAEAREAIERAFAEGLPQAMAARRFDAPRLHGGTPEERWWRPHHVPVFRPDGTLSHVLHHLEDVTGIVRAGDRRREEQRLAEALRDAEQRYRALFLANPFPMWVYDRATLAFLAVNDAAVRLYGWSREEFLRLTLRDVRPPEEVPSLLEHLARVRDGASPREWRHRTRDGRTLDVEVGWQRLRFSGRDAAVAYAQDVTARRRLQDQLRQSQKMEAVGQLASGGAHDFNNLLTVILGYGELVQHKLPPGDEAVQDAQEIVAVAERAATLTRQLLAFSRAQGLEPRVLDLNEVVTGIEPMLRRVLGEHIDLVTVAFPELGCTRADPGQIEQILLNLAVNARDAMPGGGRLTIETANVDLDGSYTSGHPGLAPGPYVMLAVSDDGSGMDPELQARIFEPFFTTKERGTGLGLATVRGIVQECGGHIEVYSQPGHGSTFKVYLPRIESRWTAEPEPKLPPPLRRAPNETILLVEDDDALRGVLRESLEREGYAVLEAASAEAALLMCANGDTRVDLLLTDVVMPRMSGHELLRRLATVRPELRVLFMSGYADHALLHQARRDPGTSFLQKPFTPEALARKVREALETPDVRRDVETA